MNSNTILTFVPEEEAAAWNALSFATKARAEKLLVVAQAIHKAPHGTKGELFAQFAQELGYKHVNSVSGPVNKFLKTGDWWCLIDRRTDSNTWVKTKSHKLPHAFIEHCKFLIEKNQRCIATAYDQLMEQLQRWRAGDQTQAIPGYNTPPKNAPGQLHPPSWSLKTFYRNAPTAIELDAARHGRDAALKHCPAVHTTRKSGYPGMEIQFDDVHHDAEVLFGDKICRVLEFNGIDFYSNFLLNPGIKPRQLVDGTHKELTEKEFAFHFLHFLCTTGYHPRGTLIVAENAKTVIRDALAAKISRWTNGLVKTYAAAMSGAPLISGGYSERAKGSANAKALKEASGRLIHNALASIPGQLGMNPEDMPSYLVGMRNHTNELMLAQSKLSTQLITPHYRFEDYCLYYHDRLARINNRTNHNIEGWLEEGLVTTEYLADPHNDVWLNIAMLPSEQQAAFRIIAQHSPHNFRPRKLSPYEVWTPASERFLKLSAAAEADCLYEYARRTEPVKTGYFEFSDKDMGLGKFRYRAQYQDPQGRQHYLPNDAAFHLVVNPFNPERAFIFTEKGQYLGMTPRHHAAMRSDAEAINKEQGKKAAHLAGALTSFIVRNGLKDERAMTHNARIFEQEYEKRLNPQTHQTITPSAEQESLYADCDLPEVPQASDDIDVSRLLL